MLEILFRHELIFRAQAVCMCDLAIFVVGNTLGYEQVNQGRVARS